MQSPIRLCRTKCWRDDHQEGRGSHHRAQRNKRYVYVHIPAYKKLILTPRLTGWWLARPTGSDPDDASVQGWIPSAYVEEIIATSAPPPPPPPPPASRPVPGANGVNGRAAGAKPVPTPPAKRPVGKKPAPGPGGRLSQDGGADSMAGGLADALRRRQAAMNGGQ
jgi:myosin I